MVIPLVEKIGEDYDWGHGIGPIDNLGKNNSKTESSTLTVNIPGKIDYLFYIMILSGDEISQGHTIATLYPMRFLFHMEIVLETEEH
jgi:hypothetical protein